MLGARLDLPDRPPRGTVESLVAALWRSVRALGILLVLSGIVDLIT